MRYLFKKQEITGSWIFLFGAVPCFGSALAGYEYGAFWHFFIPGVLCVVQYVYPTIILWCFFFVSFAIVAVLYTWILLLDLGRLAGGMKSKVFVDLDDSIMFFLLWSVLVFVPIMMFINRPSFSNDSDERPTSPNA